MWVECKSTHFDTSTQGRLLDWILVQFNNKYSSYEQIYYKSLADSTMAIITSIQLVNSLNFMAVVLFSGC